MKTFLKRLAGILLFLAGLHLIFIGIENWRGARAYARWQAAAIVAGEPQTMEQLAPPKIPDAENFAAHPAIKRMVSNQTQSVGPVLPAVLSNGELFRGWEEGRAVDLEALKVELQVTDMDSLLEPFAEPLRGLEEASLRPHSRLLASYEGADIPFLLGMRLRARVLSLRALIALRAGRPEAALADVLTILRVAKHLGPEPQLISQLLCLAELRLSFQPIWEGLRDHRWDDAQLARLQAALGDLDLLSAWRRCWTAEGLFTRSELAKLASIPLGSRPPIFGDTTGGRGRVVNTLGQMVLPNGWIYQNLIRIEEERHRQMIDPIDPARHILEARGMDRATTHWKQSPRSPYSFLAKLFVLDLPEQNQRMAHTQSCLDQALLACALERHRLARHAYPERLQDLLPAFAARLPGDLVNHGQPLQYRKGTQGYRLYSLGWDGLDQGGQVALDTQNPPRHNLKQGDWVWERGD